MDIKEIRSIVELMKKNGIAVFKFEEENFKITLKTNEAGGGRPVLQTYTPEFAQAAPAVAATAPAQAAVATEAEDTSDLLTIHSPMVGTYYSSPSPDSPAFVQVGQKITPDTVVCIIEAMKVMNEVKAEVSGTVVEIVGENGMPVQFGQPLFRLK